MTEKRMKELLVNCIKYIKYDNDDTVSQLHEICGFTDQELCELGFDYLAEIRRMISNERTERFTLSPSRGSTS